jgi:methylglutaconyl-CoA hydratase
MQEPLDVAMDAAGIAQVTLNRPKRANSIDSMLGTALLETFEKLANDPKLRVLVLRAAGRTFCAGLDIKAMAEKAGASFEDNYQDALISARMLHLLNTVPVPTLCVIPGGVVGLGVGLVAACDVALASELASFRFSEVRLGIIPSVISPYVIAAMGARACRRYFLSAESLDAAEAMRLGLVHQIAKPEDLDAQAARLTAELQAGKPGAQRAAKRLIDDMRFAPLTPALTEETARLLAEIRSTPEAKGALAAFLKT